MLVENQVRKRKEKHAHKGRPKKKPVAPVLDSLTVDDDEYEDIGTEEEPDEGTNGSTKNNGIADTGATYAGTSGWATVLMTIALVILAGTLTVMIYLKLGSSTDGLPLKAEIHQVSGAGVAPGVQLEGSESDPLEGGGGVPMQPVGVAEGQGEQRRVRVKQIVKVHTHEDGSVTEEVVSEEVIEGASEEELDRGPVVEDADPEIVKQLENAEKQKQPEQPSVKMEVTAVPQEVVVDEVGERAASSSVERPVQRSVSGAVVSSVGVSSLDVATNTDNSNKRQRDGESTGTSGADAPDVGLAADPAAGRVREDDKAHNSQQVGTSEEHPQSKEGLKRSDRKEDLRKDTVQKQEAMKQSGRSQERVESANPEKRTVDRDEPIENRNTGSKKQSKADAQVKKEPMKNVDSSGNTKAKAEIGKESVKDTGSKKQPKANAEAVKESVKRTGSENDSKTNTANKKESVKDTDGSKESKMNTNANKQPGKNTGTKSESKVQADTKKKSIKDATSEEKSSKNTAKSKVEANSDDEGYIDGSEILLETDPAAALSHYNSLLTSPDLSAKARLAALWGRSRAFYQLSERLGSQSYRLRAADTLKQLMSEADSCHLVFRQAGQLYVQLLQKLGRLEAVIRVLQRLVGLCPHVVSLRNQLAIQFMTLNQNVAAEEVLNETLSRWPESDVARVHLGFIRRLQGRLAEAVTLLSAGIQSDEPSVHDARFYHMLADSLMRLGEQQRSNQVQQAAVDRGLFPSFWQRSVYNVPSLQTRPFWSVEDLPEARSLINEMEASWKPLLGELLQLLNSELPEDQLSAESEQLTRSGVWRQYTVFKRGRLDQYACSRTPLTCKLLSQHPVVHKCRRCQVKFSVLEPGARSWPHTGPTNCRLRAHLGLIVPEGAGIKVAEESRSWREGGVLVIDDSLLHDVWNMGNTSCAILIVDFWHPQLTEQQRKELAPI